MTAPKMRATSVGEWKKSSQGLIELPSGKWMEIRKMGMPAMMAAGIIPNSLLSIMQSSLAKGKGNQDQIMEEVMNDPKSVSDMMVAMDAILVAVSRQPKVQVPPDNDEERKDSVLYTDEVDDLDKMFIFQLVSGGTSSLEKFREEHAADMESLSEL